MIVRSLNSDGRPSITIEPRLAPTRDLGGLAVRRRVRVSVPRCSTVCDFDESCRAGIVSE
jgi:hypothetical protein